MWKTFNEMALSMVGDTIPLSYNHETEFYSLESESFYILSFVGFMNNFKSTRRWQFRACNCGLFALMSILFLLGQMITLFDLAYEEELEYYKCLGDSARPSVVICGTLMILIVVMKMLPEERRCLGQRVVLIRHGTEFTYFDCMYKLIFETDRLHTLKVLVLQVFHSFRVYGVVTFVYVAAIEQLMLYSTIIDYVINAVVVLLIAEVDELAYSCLARLEIMPDKKGSGGSYDSFESGSVEEYDDNENNEQGNDIVTPNNADSEKDHLSGLSGMLIKQNFEPVRQSYIEHLSSAKTMQQMTEMKLTKHERDVFLVYDYVIVRCNVLAMLLPLTHGKITGKNCSVHSFLRVSEISMILLMISRILLNVYVDVCLVRHKFKGRFVVARHIFWSLLEHGLPCLGYVFLMYYVLVVQLKPPSP